jgi:hypothetical protein
MAAELEQLRVSLVAELVGREAFEQLKREVNQVKAATNSLDTTQQKLKTTMGDAEKQIRQQRQAFSQTGMQLNQFAGQVANGTSPMVAFVQQIGDVTYTLGQAGGALGRFGTFLAGPWATGILIAISVLGPLIAHLFKTKNATEELEKAEKLKKETTETLRQAILDYNLAVAKTPQAQRLAILSMIESAEADMQATKIAQRGAQNRINAIRAEIIAIQERNKVRALSLGGDIGAGGARGGAAVAGILVESNALGKLEEAEKLLNEARGNSADTFAKLLAARSRLANFDQQVANAAEKAGEKQEKAYSKAAKAAEKLRKEQEELAQEIRTFTAKDVFDFAKAMEKMSNESSSAIDRGLGQSFNDFMSVMKDQFDRMKKDIDDVVYYGADAVKTMSEAMGQAFSDGIKGMITGAMSFKQVMSNVIDSVINKLFELFVVQQITGMIAKGISAATGITLPGKAIGGPVQSGKPYMVGERGPEMFVPSRSGSIVPNGSLGGGINISVDARGASDPAAVRQQVELGIAQAAPYIIAAAQNRTLKTAGRARLPGTIG